MLLWVENHSLLRADGLGRLLWLTGTELLCPGALWGKEKAVILQEELVLLTVTHQDLESELPLKTERCASVLIEESDHLLEP